MRESASFGLTGGASVSVRTGPTSELVGKPVHNRNIRRSYVPGVSRSRRRAARAFAGTTSTADKARHTGIAGLYPADRLLTSEGA